ncbi:DUF1702 family protein [Jidongwangia harbinensis]|uniref:DUF1702 family protein n=1 Tax=Jidongwangia harbinensis TaxID=2878561 RepID=UPI001CD9238B|nr:DUF1702 family protein [Jidongwangia harbinensis]MCA2219262.1 DUF1702 family protein [Jidongwangia harbinensis]
MTALTNRPRHRRGTLTRRVVLTASARDPERFEPLLDSFVLRDDWQRARTRTVLGSFLRGYHAFARAVDLDEVHADLAGVDRYYRPFAYEGAAMGFGPWAFLNRRGYRDFDAVLGEFHPQTVYQNYVGLGWWLATRPALSRPGTAAVTGMLHPHFRLLPYEGIGFRAGFLGAGRTSVTRSFARYGAGPAHVCFQGYGRSLWFACMGDLGRAAALIGALPAEVHGDCWSGLGLGFAYSWLDRAEYLAQVVSWVPDEFRADFFQGTAFGWEARQRADRPLFDALTGRLGEAQRVYIAGSLRAVARARDDLADRGVRDSFYLAWRAGTRTRLPASP